MPRGVLVLVQVAEVQGRDEGALADEVDALKEAAAREAAERKALLEMEYEQQHDEALTFPAWRTDAIERSSA